MPSARRLRLLALAALALCPAAAAAQEVGTAGAVNPATTATPPSRATRVLELGSRIIFRERVNTTASGNAQLIFLDKTTMSVGPNSQVVIDEFVYDPNAGTGRLTASVAKGVLRYVGGNISHSGGAQIRTPAATLGIRGGAATVQVTCADAGAWSCATKVTNHFGEVRITSANGTEIIRRAGFTVTVAAPGAQPSSAARVTQAEVDEANQSLTSKPGQTGGGRASPAAVERANVAGPVIAQILPGTSALQSRNQARQQTVSTALGLSRSPTDAQTVTQLQLRANSIGQQVTQQNTQLFAGESRVPESTVADPIAPPIAPPTETPAPVVTPAPIVVPARAFALEMGIDPALGSPAPYLPAGFVAPGRFSNSKVLGYGVGGTNPDGTPNTTRRVLQAGLNINGQGAAQTSTIYVFAGTSFKSAVTGQNTFAGGFTGTTRLAANTGVGRANGGFVGNGGAVTLDSDFVPTSITGFPGNADNDMPVPEAAFFVPGNGTTGETYTFTQTANSAATPSGLGSSRPTAALSGFAAAVGRTTNGTQFTGPAYPIEANVAFQLDGASSRFGATITATNVGSTQGGAMQRAVLKYGYQGDATQGGRGTYVDYDNFGARESRNLGSTGAFPTTVNGAPVTEHRGVFVTAQTVNVSSFFPGVNFCQCEFTRWGFWSSQTIRPGPLFDSVQLGTWVAGQTISAAEMPRTGTASYSGHVIANISNGANQYVAAGNLNASVNFGTGIGSATVPGLDGTTYSGTLTAPTGSTAVGANLSGIGPNSTARQIELIGQFYRGAAGPAGEMAGGVRVTGGTTYFGRGTFAASTPRIGP